MKNLVINGWNVGLDKVLLTKTLRAEFDYSLSEGKSITDKVVDNEEVKIPLNREASEAEELVRKLREIGAKASIES
jgi:ribosomal protein L7/L12